METVIRVAAIFAFLTIALRIIGKRELGEMSGYELVLIILIPEILSQGLIGEDFSVTNAIIGVSTLLSLVLINSFLSYRFKKYRNILEGEPVILYFKGKLMEEALDKERVNLDDLLNEIREIGYERFDQMKWIVLEPDGKISCIPFSPPRTNPEGEFIS